MQTVIFAAGEGTRLRPLTYEKPKPLIEVAGKPILERTLLSLPDVIKEVILVIGYKGEMIRNHFNEKFGDIEIKYAVQERPLGTFHALKTAEPFLDNKPFLCLMGDDLYKKEDLEKLAQYERAILVVEREDVGRFGVCVSDSNGNLKEIIEKPEGYEKKGDVWTGAAVLTREIFDEKIIQGKNGEQVLPPMMANMSAKYPVKIIKADFWFPIGYPEDIKKAEKIVS